MFKKLLVPLDGSPMAEAALAPAAYITQWLGADVALIHAIERDSPNKVHGEKHLTDPAEAVGAGRSNLPLLPGPHSSMMPVSCSP